MYTIQKYLLNRYLYRDLFSCKALRIPKSVNPNAFNNFTEIYALIVLYIVIN